jgi:hypothetical protein
MLFLILLMIKLKDFEEVDLWVIVFNVKDVIRLFMEVFVCFYEVIIHRFIFGLGSFFKGIASFIFFFIIDKYMDFLMQI